MRKMTLGWGILTMLAVLAMAVGCSDEDPTIVDNDPPEPGNLPVIPVPSSTNELMPARTGDLVIGMSSELGVFEPLVSELEMMLDDGSEVWLPQNRHLILACQDVLPMNTGDPAAVNPSYINARPYLLHTRHWRRLEQNNLSPGTSYTLEKEVTYGVSSSHTESTEFSQTIGVEVSVGGSWGAFSASVTASYEQTSTHSEMNSVTISEETTETRYYNVAAPASGTRVYVLWQLVDEFSFVDADTIPIHASPTLVHVKIPAITNILLPNENVVTMKTTDFD
jgi:hypothetical protein